MGYRIFVLCLRQLAINWRVAVRLSWFWVLLSVGIGALSVPQMYELLAQMETGAQVEPNSAIPLLMIALVIASLVGSAAIAIGWHRWVLRDEEPDNMFVLRRGWPVWGYIWRYLAIGLIGLICLILPSALFIGLSGGLGQSGLLSVLLNLLFGTLATWIMLRIGLILPALAVGERLSFAESVRLTAPVAGSLVLTALYVTVFQSLPSFLGAMVGGADTEVVWYGYLAVLAVFTWINFFVSIGILTVVYGHTVENRPI